MRWVNFIRNRHDSGVFESGVVENGSIVCGSETISFEDVTWLAPCVPTKIIGVGLNYRDHASEMNKPIPKEPLLFLKAPSAINAHRQPIVLPAISQQVEYEGELAVVIKKTASHVPKEKAHEYILGYTCFNDVTARDLQRRDVQFSRAKSFDTFACVGHWIETELDPSNLKIQTRLNGRQVQSSTTAELIFDIPTLIEFISEAMTLFAGDIITTGTPAGVGPLSLNDVVEVEIESIGVLENHVVAAKNFRL